MVRLPAAFVFLILAWLCANWPQTGVSGFLDSVGFRGAVSHQAHLADEVRTALARDAMPTTPPAESAVAKSQSPTEKPTAPAEESSLHKLVMLAPALEQPFPHPGARAHRSAEQWIAETRPQEVPVPPPRSG